MAFTGSPTSSTEYARQVSIAKGNPGDLGLPMQFATFNYTHDAGAGVGEINLLKLPAGRIVVWPQFSYLSASQFAANSDLHLGHRSYVEPDGDTVAEDDDEWVADATVHTGPISGPLQGTFATVFTNGTEPGATVYESIDGIVVFASIDSGNIEDTDTISGWIAYQRLG